MIINKNKDSYLVLVVVEEEGIVVVVLQPFPPKSISPRLQEMIDIANVVSKLVTNTQDLSNRKDGRLFTI